LATSKKTKGKSKVKSQKSLEQQTVPDAETAAEGQEGALKSDFMDDFLFHAANYIYVRRKLFITISIIILVLISSGWGTFEYIEYRENQRNEKPINLEKVIYDTSLSSEQKFQKALPLLEAFLDEHPDSKQSSLALFYRAGLSFSQKNYGEAETDLKTLLSKLESGTDLYLMFSVWPAWIYPVSCVVRTK